MCLNMSFIVFLQSTVELIQFAQQSLGAYILIMSQALYLLNVLDY